ncbi:MAG: hypothetical protein H7259_05040 [Cytophagales bacterium]|nr:hypothetical protein [Cytophaga sp.]
MANQNYNTEINDGMKGCIGVLIFIAGVLVKFFYTGTLVDKHNVAEQFGTNVHGHKLAIFAILFLKFAASAWGYIIIIVIGLYILISAIRSAIKK